MSKGVANGFTYFAPSKRSQKDTTNTTVSPFLDRPPYPGPGSGSGHPPLSPPSFFSSVMMASLPISSRVGGGNLGWNRIPDKQQQSDYYHDTTSGFNFPPSVIQYGGGEPRSYPRHPVGPPSSGWYDRDLPAPPMGVSGPVIGIPGPVRSPSRYHMDVPSTPEAARRGYGAGRQGNETDSGVMSGYPTGQAMGTPSGMFASHDPFEGAYDVAGAPPSTALQQHATTDSFLPSQSISRTESRRQDDSMAYHRAAFATVEEQMKTFGDTRKSSQQQDNRRASQYQEKRRNSQYQQLTPQDTIEDSSVQRRHSVANAQGPESFLPDEFVHSKRLSVMPSSAARFAMQNSLGDTPHTDSGPYYSPREVVEPSTVRESGGFPDPSIDFSVYTSTGKSGGVVPPSISTGAGATSILRYYDGDNGSYDGDTSNFSVGVDNGGSHFANQMKMPPGGPRW
ncbi:hypothetical protein HDU93_003988 [Gonapodya sp. JEL0774]|nr:hypothetical protein HDU93_003988 [Gonapodya sp. JEL0774]